MRWILDAVRQFGVEQAMQVAELAAARQDRGVVAFGIGGSEERGPAEWFTDVFAFAKSEGLHLVAHAGEGTSAQSIWAALELGAERIGHGISAIEDEALMRHLRDRGIPLEICITSNLVTGVVKRLEDHPVRRLFDAGVPITLNTDDPAMFRCSLVGEYELAKTPSGSREWNWTASRRQAFEKRLGHEWTRMHADRTHCFSSLPECRPPAPALNTMLPRVGSSSRVACSSRAGAAMDALFAVECGTPVGPGVRAWPEHISMHIFAAQRSQKSG